VSKDRPCLPPGTKPANAGPHQKDPSRPWLAVDEEGTTIRRVTHPTHTDRFALEPGDRVEVGGRAGNRAYRFLYRVQQLGEGWKTAGPHGVIADAYVSPPLYERAKRGRR
jgi:hypothetical protein